MTHEIIWHQHGTYRRFFGTVTAKELQAVDEAFYSDPRALRIRYQILDASEADALEITEREIRDRAAYDLGFSRSTCEQRVALISRDPDTIAAFEFYAELMRSKDSSWTFGTFHDAASALAWAKG
ncbi:hypothetical protein [Pelagicoccus sp. SDUM812003]|uniref:hypothetical protein n=1 Tax=Pelagicoccus sp. SDUM812003 TaxID=3041267 RepID=UPI00280EB576|nr:hypothetical protein [Pelagicoccus sp. SDUM812003]MDQ8202359.1 hypothetical protein [Pelagicoccus sp. SDUM812003]